MSTVCLFIQFEQEDIPVPVVVDVPEERLVDRHRCAVVCIDERDEIVRARQPERAWPVGELRDDHEIRVIDICGEGAGLGTA